MSTNSQNNDFDNQEIDLSRISKKLGGFFEKVSIKIFKGILFIKRNLILIGVLFILGGVMGHFMDRNNTNYDNQIIVTPNFFTTDYLYNKIDLINSKVNEGDTVFLKNVVGLKDVKKFTGIKIEPIIDIYKFIGTNPVNFEFVKLLAEDGDLKKIVEDKLTSKNYLFHNISFSTSNLTQEEKTVKPLLEYLNNSDYYKKIQIESIKNIQIKIEENDSIISQINGVLNSFSSTINSPTKSDKLVYYNDNTQLNDVIKTKNELITEQGYHRVELLGLDKIIKESSATINIKNTKGVNGRMTQIMPLVLLGIFFILALFRNYYRKQLLKNSK